MPHSKQGHAVASSTRSVPLQSAARYQLVPHMKCVDVYGVPANRIHIICPCVHDLDGVCPIRQHGACVERCLPFEVFRGRTRIVAVNVLHELVDDVNSGNAAIERPDPDSGHVRSFEGERG